MVVLRFFPVISSALKRLTLAVSLGLAGLAPASAAPPRRPPPPTSAATDAEIVRAQAVWASAIRKLPAPPAGCYAAAYPQVEWQSVPCGPPPEYPILPSHGAGHPFTVGGGGSGDFAARTSAITSGAEGTFVAVSPGITESGLVNNAGAAKANAYSLQLNTEFFTTTACAASPNPACRGWAQYVYENNDVSHRAFIQYWLIAYNTACPAGWTTKPLYGGTYCYRNSGTSSLPAGVPVSNFGSLTVAGSAGATSDQVVVTAGGNSVTVVGLNAVAAASGWHDSEFNVFGDAGGGQANFGANTTLTVRTIVHSGTTAAPTCQTESFTAETNNLTLVGMAAIPTQASPAIEFTQSNIAGAAAACVAANGVGDTHLKTFTGLLYDFQATGDFTLARTGSFEVQTRQMSGAPTWPDAAVNQAVAARLGKAVVAICSGDGPLVIIDGERRTIAEGAVIDLGDGSGIRHSGNVLTLIDSDGNSLRAELMGSYINATVGLGHWPVAVQGLLASSGRAGTLLTARNGTPLPAPYAFADLYGTYGNSWRVPARQSLLRACGPARESKSPGRPFTVANLPEEKAREARTICQRLGVRDKALIDACTLDVAVLGSKRAAEVFGHIGHVTALGVIK